MDGLEWIFYVRPKEPPELLCPMKRPRDHTIQQGNQEGANERKTSATRCSAVTLFCRPELVMWEVVTKLDSLIVIEAMWWYLIAKSQVRGEAKGL